MIRAFANALASISLALKQPLPSFCDIETAHGGALVSKRGDYVSWLRIDGTRRMLTGADVARIATALRVEISGTLDNRGHAVCASYVSDPDASGVEIARVSLDATREVARLQRLDLHDLLDERAALWPSKMRWEAVHFVLWTRQTVLTKEERRQVREEQNAMARQGPPSATASASTCAPRSWPPGTTPSSAASSARCAATASPARRSPRTRA